eukprot:scaffold7843_cov376-Prasinococcus_capsulatus_cf.AAC.1
MGTDRHGILARGAIGAAKTPMSAAQDLRRTATAEIEPDIQTNGTVLPRASTILLPARLPEMLMKSASSKWALASVPQQRQQRKPRPSLRQPASSALRLPVLRRRAAARPYNPRHSCTCSAASEDGDNVAVAEDAQVAKPQIVCHLNSQACVA